MLLRAKTQLIAGVSEPVPRWWITDDQNINSTVRSRQRLDEMLMVVHGARALIRLVMVIFAESTTSRTCRFRKYLLLPSSQNLGLLEEDLTAIEHLPTCNRSELLQVHDTA